MRRILPILSIVFLSSAASAANPSNPPLAPLPMPPDITVAADGSGNFTTIQAALDSIPKDNHQRLVILVKDGVYKERLRVDPSFITIRGQSRTGTRIEYPIPYSDWQRSRDPIGRAVVNLGPSIAPRADDGPGYGLGRGDHPPTAPDITGSDFVLQNITVKNTAGIQGHSFAFYTETADRVVITDSDILSEGNDTLAPMNSNYHGGGHYYFVRLNVRGGVDFVCPKGWCYLADSTLTEVRAADASVWHNGSGGKDQKFVLRNVRFNGDAARFTMARHHVAANFYFMDCTFAKNMADKAPYLVRYPAGNPTNEMNDKMNLWGERTYFFNCHREPAAGDAGGDFPWMKDNLDTAEGSPKSDQITAAWTFDNTWDPESTIGPAIKSIIPRADQIAVTFSESITVEGKPRLLTTGQPASYASGSGTDTLLFDAPTTPTPAAVQSLDLHGGYIFATQASATTRLADLTLPK